MTNLQQLEALNDAAKIIYTAKVSLATDHSSMAVYAIVHHADNYLGAQINAILRAE